MKQTLISALKISGKVLLKHFGTSFEIRIKESQSSIVTTADLKSDSLIVAYIQKSYPRHNIISEEGGYLNNNSEYTWVIDPLDGTSNFASGLPWFGVLIALFFGNEPVMGGAYLPLEDKLYFAEKGKGVMMNGKLFQMIGNTELKNSLITFSVDYTPDEHYLNSSIALYKAIVENVRNIRCTNSLVDFIYTAEGKTGGCINLNTRIWDISALGLILSEAGGKMTDLNGDQIKFILNDEVADRNFPVIGGSEEIINALKNVIKKEKNQRLL